MNKIVQKFGGTSLDDKAKRKKVAQIIKNSKEKGRQILVVVSAMGRRGKPYATDTLLQQIEDPSYLDKREKDLLMSCGEIISSVVMVQQLKMLGLKAKALTGGQAGIITDDNFGEARVQQVNKKVINKLFKKDIIPVVAGFQGITVKGEITTLGRGGSDTTASILGAALDADFIEIYTDVAGVMTADPKSVKQARLLKKINYKEICELAYQGARVIHPRAVEIAMQDNLPIKIKSITDQQTGTMIHNCKSDYDKLITGVASIKNIIFISIQAVDAALNDQELNIFSTLQKEDISADFINIRRDAISFIINKEYEEKILKILSEKNLNYNLRKDLVKVSAVGGGMTGQPGVMARIIKYLYQAEIPIFQATDSHITISCLLNKRHEKKALNVLHEKFSLDST